MTLLLGFWILSGLAHWLNYMFAYNPKFIVLDFVCGLPFFVLCGPISFFRRYL